MVAGEASGDMYGAEVARYLFKKFPGCRIYGLGGQRMRRAGVHRLQRELDRWSGWLVREGVSLLPVQSG